MFIPINLDNVQESKPVPAGRYDLVITSVEQVLTKESRKPQLDVSIAIEGHDEAPSLRHFVSLASPDGDPKKEEFKRILLARFLQLFRIPHTSEGFDLDDFVGARANAELTIDQPEGKTDTYNRLQVPKMQDESEKPSAATRKAPKR